MFRERYGNVVEGPKEWRELSTTTSEVYRWNGGSTYVQNPPYFEDMPREPGAVSDVSGPRILTLLSDSITTDPISPAAPLHPDSPAAPHLTEPPVRPGELTSSRAAPGTHELLHLATSATTRTHNKHHPAPKTL